MTAVELKLMITVFHSFRFNLVCNRNKWAFLLKILFFVRDCGVTTQRRGAILGVTDQKRLGSTDITRWYWDDSWGNGTTRGLTW